jgi:hypothetical protein
MSLKTHNSKTSFLTRIYVKYGGFLGFALFQTLHKVRLYSTGTCRIQANTCSTVMFMWEQKHDTIYYYCCWIDQELYHYKLKITLLGYLLCKQLKLSCHHCWHVWYSMLSNRYCNISICGHEANHSTLTNGQVKCVSIYMSTLPYIITVWCLSKHKGIFTLSLVRFTLLYFTSQCQLPSG